MTSLSQQLSGGARLAGDAPLPTMTVKSRHVRVPLTGDAAKQDTPEPGLGPRDISYRPPKAKSQAVVGPTAVRAPAKLFDTAFGPCGASGWSRGTSTRKTRADELDRGLLMQSEAHHESIRSAGLSLRQPLQKFKGGDWSENVLVGAEGCAETLCIGDILAVRPGRRSADDIRAEVNRLVEPQLLLQVTAPRRPCSKVDQAFGQTWGAGGVRAYAASNGTAGWFVRVLQPGELCDGDELQVIERPQPNWPLARVCNLLYGMEGAASSPRGYALPGFGTERGDTAPMALGGGAAAIRSKWQGTKEELRELATMPELARFEWREEFEAMIECWEADEPSAARRIAKLCGPALGAAIALAATALASTALVATPPLPF